MASYKWILYGTQDEGTIAKITLNRPERRNAQHEPLLREVNDAFLKAEADPNVRVVILTGAGPSFSSGHDLGSPEAIEWREQHPRKPGAEARYRHELEVFLGFSRRWRDLTKITIAQVQGYCVAAGLMLAWPCDLIIAAEDAKFGDPVPVRLGLPGVEYFGHPWEFGARKAKELLLLGDTIDAKKAEQIGMVNKVVPVDKLEEETLAIARRVAKLDTSAALWVKQAVNVTQDMQGMWNAMQTVLWIHNLGHAHHGELTGGKQASSANMREGKVSEWTRKADVAAGRQAGI
ncbi:MAG: enoyl-CoA hydratase [Chloroflexi bacterium]|nr:enoyl-CoA hydratase [Chloroflexota bacterium]